MLKLSSEIGGNATPGSTRRLMATGTTDMVLIWQNLRRQWKLVAGITFAMIGLSVFYLLTTPPRYTAVTEIVIDPRKSNPYQAQATSTDQLADAAYIESQVGIIKSESVALSVINKLRLATDPEFSAPSAGLIGTVIGLITRSETPRSDYERERLAVTTFAKNIAVKRVGTTYVVQIAFTSLHRARASEIPNAISDAYMVGELEARYQSTRRASGWLQARLKELRQQATEADEAVQRFKSDNNIVDTNRGLMSDQQLAEVNNQLVTARASTAEAKARLDRVQEIARSDVPEATVTDALRNEVITRLRAQYLDLAAKEADWSARYGYNHAAAANLRNQMREIKRSISDELRRIAETYRSEYEIALTREKSLQQSLDRLVTQSAVTSQAQVKLRDLESSAQTARNLYDTFLQRSMEATQQLTFPVSDARVITAATEPLRRSHPQPIIVLGGGAFAGIMIGLATAIVRSKMDRVFRTPADVEQFADIECLGIAPKIRVSNPTGDQRLDVENKLLAQDLGIYRHAVKAPFSRFAETLRSVKVAADLTGLAREMKVIGVTSSVPREGKTVLSVNLAQLLAQSGHRVLLIDGDLRNPSLTRSIVPVATSGLIDVLNGEAEIVALWTDPVTSLRVLPAALRTRLSNTAELISSRAMAELLARARKVYDFIVIDLPPIVPVVDTIAISHLVDGFVFAIEWNTTTHDAVREALSIAGGVRDRLLGSVLTQGDPSALKQLEAHRGRHYNNYYVEHVDRPLETA